MKNLKDSTGNRTRDFPVCRAVLQQTSLPRTPFCILQGNYNHHKDNYLLRFIRRVTWLRENPETLRI